MKVLQHKLAHNKKKKKTISLDTDSFHNSKNIENIFARSKKYEDLHTYYEYLDCLPPQYLRYIKQEF